MALGVLTIGMNLLYNKLGVHISPSIIRSGAFTVEEREMQKVLSSIIQMTAAITITGCFLGLPTLAKKGELGYQDKKVAIAAPSPKRSPSPKPSPSAKRSPSPKPSGDKWAKRTKEFIGKFKMEAKKIPDITAQKKLVANANIKSQNQRLIQIGQANCNFLRSGRFIRDLDAKRNEYLSKKPEKDRILLRYEYNTVNKTAYLLCPELRHLMEL